MKLCVLGPVNTVTRNAGIIKDAFPELDVYEAAYDVYTEALDMIDQIQQEADMVLFPGKASYALCKRSRRQLIPWEYLPRHISSLHRTLLEVQRRFHCGICRISYDTLDSSLILSIRLPDWPARRSSGRIWACLPDFQPCSRIWRTGTAGCPWDGLCRIRCRNFPC